ncbi:MAG: hypothetical protein J6W29_00520 [Neisseriaceae bacterium]|nr:hypothetical protein [Neisseriaceae bacterium]
MTSSQSTFRQPEKLPSLRALLYYSYYLRLHRLVCFWSELTMLHKHFRLPKIISALPLFIARRLPRRA